MLYGAIVFTHIFQRKVSMKQLFLSLALLTSGFVYSADQASQNLDLTKLTLAGLNLTTEEIGHFTKIANFRGMALTMESSAVDSFYNLIKSDEKIIHKFSMTGPGDTQKNTYLCDVTLVKRSAGELIKGEDGEEHVKHQAFHFEFEVKNGSLLHQVVAGAFKML